MRGIYRDRLRGSGGRILFDSGWRGNTIVDAAWPLVGGLLKNDPSVKGILFWAVGEGMADWDAALPPGNAGATALISEVDRMPLDPEAMVYIGDDGRPSAGPTPCIEVMAAFTWGRNRVLREFGLFGGDATAARGSGTLINHVAHQPIAVAAGRSLTRRLRLTLCPAGGLGWERLPIHWLAEEPVIRIDGVGASSAESLGRVGIVTIGDLAVMTPVDLDDNVTLMRAVELRAKARMALRTVAGVKPVVELNNLTAWEVLASPAATLIADSGAPADVVLRLQEQAGALQLTLDNRYLRQVTVGRLARQR